MFARNEAVNIEYRMSNVEVLTGLWNFDIRHSIFAIRYFLVAAMPHT